MSAGRGLRVKIFGNGIKGGIIGVAADSTFVVSLTDAQGLLRDDLGTDVVTVDIEGPDFSKIIPTVVRTREGFKVTYLPHSPGDYSVAVYYKGKLLNNGKKFVASFEELGEETNANDNILDLLGARPVQKQVEPKNNLKVPETTKDVHPEPMIDAKTTVTPPEKALGTHKKEKPANRELTPEEIFKEKLKREAEEERRQWIELQNKKKSGEFDEPIELKSEKEEIKKAEEKKKVEEQQRKLDEELRKKAEEERKKDQESKRKMDEEIKKANERKKQEEDRKRKEETLQKQQERDRQERERQEKDRQERLDREKQERIEREKERQQKLEREKQVRLERERQEKLEHERQEKLEHERQEKLEREKQERLYQNNEIGNNQGLEHKDIQKSLVEPNKKKKRKQDRSLPCRITFRFKFRKRSYQSHIHAK